jgi:F-box/leucine-rich repeat protein 2/20
MNEQKIDLLTSLPKELACQTLLEWVSLQDVTVLDVAYCSTSLRDLFLQVLSSDLFVYDEMPVHFMRDVPAFITWAVSRGVRMNTADIPSDIHNTIIQRFIRECTTRNLKCIVLHRFPSDAKVFSALCKERPQLCDLILQTCNLGKSTTFMLKGLSNLKLLSFESCEGLKTTLFKGLQLPLLHTLTLTDSKCDDECLTRLLSLSTALNKISLTDCTNLTSAGIYNAFAPRCETLLTLCLQGARNLTDETIVTMSRLCPVLHSVDFSHCVALTDASLIALSVGCKRLQRAYLHHNNNYTDTAMSAIAEHCHQLIALHVAHCAAVTSFGIYRVLEECQELDTLYIGSPLGPTSAELAHIVTKCAKLTYKLSLHVPVIDDSVLLAMAKHCKNIHHIDFHACSGYTERGVMALVRACTKLQNFVLSDRSALVVQPLVREMWEFLRPGLEVRVGGELGYDILA